MSDPQDAAARIRNQRLAKLSARSAAAAESSNETASLTSATLKSEGEETQNLLTSENTTSSTPAAASPRPTSGIKIDALSPKPASRLPSTAGLDPEPSHASRSPQPAEPADWEHATLSNLFRLTLNPDRKQDSHGHRLYYVAGLASSLIGEYAPLRLKTSSLDDALVEAGTALGPLKYLLACWKRICRLQRNMSGRLKPYQSDILKEARRLCMSYIIFAAEMPDMFGEESSDGSRLAPFLLREPDGDDGICHDFLSEVEGRIADDDMAEHALISALEDLTAKLSTISFVDPDFQTHVNVLSRLVRYKQIAVATARSSHFLPKSEHATLVETETLLGPYFRISPMQREVQDSYYNESVRADQSRSMHAIRSLQLPGKIHQGQLFEIVSTIIRASPEARERTLDWFGAAIKLNLRRKGLQADERKFSSDGFMLNLTSVLDKLCEPFMDENFSKIDRADIDYFKRHPRLDTSDETSLNADQKEANEFHSQIAPGTNNFITEIFFLTAAAHHYGAGVAEDKLTDSDRSIKYLKKNLDQMKVEQQRLNADASSNPIEKAQLAVHIKRVEERIDRVEKTKLALQSALSEEQYAAQTIQFVRFLSCWLLRAVEPVHQYPHGLLKLPLPEDQPMDFRCLPEFLITDVIDTYQFTFRFMPQILVRTQVEQLVVFCITFLESSESIRNPGLKAGLVSILFGGVHPGPGLPNGILGDILNGLQFANDHLLHALIKAYIEAERTGSHNQFYDKFNIRYELFQVIKCIWKNPLYHTKLLEESEKNNRFFVQFVNMLVNDVTFVLDEAITALKTVHEVQQELKSTTLSAEEKQEKEEKLAQEEGKASSYMQLTNETIAMFNLFTRSIPQSFVAPEIVQRLADMLDHNLDTLVSPTKFQNLRVEDPKKYGYQPRILLTDVLRIYLNLAHSEPFVLAIARDGRSYRPETFQHAHDLMSKKLFAPLPEIQKWQKLAQAVAAKKAEEELEDADMDDAPDEFLDPLLATMMTDPVILPSSRNNVDMSTIRAHLLSDPTDPFNRVPLRLEDVRPNDELRGRIEAFRAEKRAQRGRVAAEKTADEMDLT